MLAETGHHQQASHLADTFHNLPQETWRDDFSMEFFRESFLKPYLQEWAQGSTHHYLVMLTEAERLA
jgi:hypothetical protein